MSRRHWERRRQLYGIGEKRIFIFLPTSRPTVCDCEGFFLDIRAGGNSDTTCWTAFFSARPGLRRFGENPSRRKRPCFFRPDRSHGVAWPLSVGERHLRTRLGGGDKNIITYTIGFCARRTRRVYRIQNEAEMVNDERFAVVNHRRRIGRDSAGNGFEPAHTRPTNERAGVIILFGSNVHRMLSIGLVSRRGRQLNGKPS